MWALDRDLLALEPNLFRDVGWAGQQLVRSTGRFTSGTIQLESGSFDLVRTLPGMVATVGRTSVELVGEPSGTTASVSLIRNAIDAQPLPPADSDITDVVVSTFRPQIQIVHRHLLSMLGLEPAAGGTPGALTEDAVTNPHELALLESLGAIHLIYSAAAAPGGSLTWLDARAETYRRRFAEERWRALARLDTDADGLPDAVRRFNVMRLQRA